MGKKTVVPHRHTLYEAAVQSVDVDIDFVQRIYKKYRGRTFARLREDFCGTASLSCEWARRGEKNHAWGVDLHGPTLEWGRKNRLALLGKSAKRVHLIQADVRSAAIPKTDVAVAFNFSYSVFKERELLRDYFSAVRRSLRRGGIFLVDALGGQETMGELVEKRKVHKSKERDGTRVPGFTYVWDQARFNAINHDLLCHIHFHLKDGKKIRKAFTYDWRLWTLPELRELMQAAGFASSEVYLDGWDEDEEEGDGIYRRRTFFENQQSWVAYVIGLT
jgi:SAM-dependent methyltransferase